MKDKAGIAAVLSFLIPGLGQMYNGAFLRGLFWLIVTLTGSYAAAFDLAALATLAAAVAIMRRTPASPAAA